MKRSDGKITVVFFSGLALATSHVTFAHHSYAMFDTTKQSQVSGAVRSLEWTNPHIWLWVTATDEHGAAALYAFEGTSINEMSRRSNWKKNAVVPGDKVMVTYRPFKDDRKGGRIIFVTLPNGVTLNADTGLQVTYGPGGVTPPTPPPTTPTQ